MNIESPPAPDSPRHILNVLNDDCIQLVFRRLENVRDFLNAAEACTQFQENAKLTFRAQYKKIRIGNLCEDPSNCLLYHQNSYTMTVDRAQNFLSIFGHLVKELEFNVRTENQKHDGDIQNIIADYCGKTLRTYVVGTRNPVEQPVSVNFNTQSPLQALEKLEILNANVYNFEFHLQLKSLTVTGVYLTHFDWMFQAFPKLETVKFVGLHELQYKQAIRFIKLNPQLKSLKIEYCKKLTQGFIKKIANFIPNLKKLRFWSTQSSCSNEQMIHIGNLRHLKSLFIFASTVPVEKLIDSLIQNNVSIEMLGILCENSYSLSNLNILQLKLLKKVCLTQITNETLIDFVKNLPELKEIMASESPEITLKGIKGALQYAKQLSVLIVDLIETALDLDELKSIANLSKLRRVKVTINIENVRTIDVPTGFLEANRKWLSVNFENCFGLNLFEYDSD